MSGAKLFYARGWDEMSCEVLTNLNHSVTLPITAAWTEVVKVVSVQISWSSWDPWGLNVKESFFSWVHSCSQIFLFSVPLCHAALFKLGGWLCGDGCCSSCVLLKMKCSIPVVKCLKPNSVVPKQFRGRSCLNHALKIPLYISGGKNLFTLALSSCFNHFKSL